MSISLIGSGISAISLGRLLQEQGCKPRLIEKSNGPGGLIRCEDIGKRLYHKVGGHVFNSKNIKVLNWFWEHFNLEQEFVHAQRNAKVWLNDKYVGYPIENHLHELQGQIVESVIDDWLGSGYSDPDSYRDDTLGYSEKSEPDGLRIGGSEAFNRKDFKSFLIHKFGPTLFKLYFGPYNEKIWQTDLSQVSLDWLEGKLPMPNLKDAIIQNIFKKEETEMVHSTFYYPKKGGSQFIIDRLSDGLDIRTNYEVRSIKKISAGWRVNDKLEADKVVYTGDIRSLHQMLQGIDHEIMDACQSVKGLKSNGTSNVLCECDPTDISWLYIPDPSIKAHRIIYTGNFSEHNNAPKGRLTCTVEFSGQVSKDVMQSEVKKLPGNLEVLASNYEPNSYVIQEQGTRAKVDRVRQLLESQGFFLLGRFAEWEYYNIDKCIERAMELTPKIISK